MTVTGSFTAAAATTTNILTVTYSETEISTSTFVSSVILSQTVTQTATTAVTSTCHFFNLQISGGAVDGQHVVSQGDSNKLAFSSSTSSNTIFEINNLGQLTTTAGLIANTDNAQLYYVYINTQATITSSGYVALQCQKTPSLQCTDSNGQTQFAVCPAIGPGDPGPGPALLFGTTSTSDCSYVSLNVRCA